MRRIASFMLAVSVCAAGAAFAGENWPRFRGPDGTGVADDSRFPDTWSETQNVAWKADLPGRGWSSPVVWGKRVFLSTAVSKEEPPEAKKGLYFGGERRDAPQDEHAWKVLCLDLDTGKTLWERTAQQGRPDLPLHIKNTYASETPVTDGERVYVAFGNVGLFCYDLAGNLVWSRKIEPQKTRLAWGPAASPVLYGERLFYVYDNQDQSYAVALDKRTGKEAWRIDRDESSNWATPFVWEHDGRAELVTPGSARVRSYDLDAKLLWELEGMSTITIATPFSVNGLLYISSGYVNDKNRPLYAIRPGAKGDITLSADANMSEFIAWCQRTEAPYNPSTLVYRGRVYVLYDRGFLACFDAATGAPMFGAGRDKKRIGNGGSYTASPWASDGKVYCLNEDGETAVFAAGDEFRLLHTNNLAADDMAMATPAIVGDRLLIRTANRLYCIAR